MLVLSVAAVVAALGWLPSPAAAQATATTSAALVVPTSFAGTDWAYVGCFTDPSTTGAAHVLAGSYTDSSTNTQESCVRTCNDAGYGYAGLVYKSQCTCGDTLSPLAVKQDESQCNSACAGDSTGTSTCGGAFRVSLFTNPKLLAAASASGASSAPSSTTSSAAATTSSSARMTTSVRSSTTSLSPRSSSIVQAIASSSSAAVASSSASASASAIAAGAGASTGGGGSSTGAIAGGVIGGLAALIAAIVAVVLLKRRKRRNAEYNDRPRSSFVGASGGSNGGGGGGWARGGSVEDHEDIGPASGGLAGVGASRHAARKEPSGFESGSASAEKIGMDEIPVVPISSPHHPANAYPHQPQQAPYQYQYDHPPQHQQQPPAYPPSYPPGSTPHMYAAQHADGTEDLRPAEKTPSAGSSASSSPPMGFTSSMQDSSSSAQLVDPFTTVGVPRRPSETSSSSHGPPALGRVVSVTRKNRKPVPVLAPEEVEDAYDGLAYDEPAAPTPAMSTSTSPGLAGRGARESFGGEEWDGAKQMRVLGVDQPLEQPR